MKPSPEADPLLKGIDFRADGLGQLFLQTPFSMIPMNEAISLAPPDARASPATQAQQAAQPSAPGMQVDRDEILQWILDLKDSSKRENALLELSKKRDSVPELPIWLWYSFGTMAALLQEVS
ncbi:unnamed protein product [Heligmosomoides polygyrus]|uniref:CCR4-NOT transcription complex subunit 9 n=1 Tax=Heligmosomoides polygyrus TaxID=6339 RepID=A0A183GXG3_HELPZ|nr:unnamed protein product [Heligmosomoides polygyrus]